MKLRHLESAELFMMTGLCVIATVVAVCIGHEHADLMIVLTALMALMAFVARNRHNRRVSTLHGTGRRRRTVA